jgi:chorismate mutase/prephenate dehydratase
LAEARQSSRAPESAGVPPELARLRERIDAIDREILARLNERAETVLEVGRVKSRSQLAVYEPTRELGVVERLRESNAGPFPDRGIGPVFREIISATRSLEEALRVAYLGPSGTFSHQAAVRQFGHLAELVPCATIRDVFAAVSRGEAGVGIVPVENTTEGIVTPTYDCLAESELTLCAELHLRVSYHLLSRSGDRSRVRQVASHPQPFAQCRRWLDAELPGVPRVEVASTATAARLAAEDDAVAALASPVAAEEYGLRAVAAGIEDRRDNATRFLVVGRDAPPPGANDLTSVVFTLRKDESGALWRLLQPFARCSVNLTSIQIRPIEGKPWEYWFFLDLEGHRSEPRVREALDAAGAVANSTRILGSFPRAAWRRDE